MCAAAGDAGDTRGQQVLPQLEGQLFNLGRINVAPGRCDP
jgi:hypothetical protein